MKFPNTLFTLLFLTCSTFLFGQETIGQASYYADDLHGRKTASGELYDKTQFTAAHRLLPFGALVQVTNLANNRAVIVKINDMGPANTARIIDLSRAAAEHLDMIRSGTANVRLEVMAEYPDEAPPGLKPGPVEVPVQTSVLPPAPASTRGNEPAPGPAPAPAPREAAFNYEILLPNIRNGHVDTDAFLIQKQAVRQAQSTRSLGPASPAEGQKPNPSMEGFGIQVGAFSGQENAIEMSRTLKSIGIENIIFHNSTQGKKTLHKVIVGPFASQADAEASKDALAKEDIAGHVISLKELE